MKENCLLCGDSSGMPEGPYHYKLEFIIFWNKSKITNDLQLKLHKPFESQAGL